MSLQRFQYQNVAFRPIEDVPDDLLFITKLFSITDIKVNYTLRDDHAADLHLFVQFLANSNKQHSGINFIIENNDLSPIGLLTASLYRNNYNGEVEWNIGYAILPPFRNKGYAKMSLQALQHILSNYSINVMVLDISTDNIASRSVAISCGFEERRSNTGGLVGYYDKDHPELGMRTQWIKTVHEDDPRAEIFKKAFDAYRSKDYSKSIQLYYKALEEPFHIGSVFTDAQIYSNLGMAFSSIRDYKKAYLYLTKAWEMGCQNASVSKELIWLRTHAADQI